MKDRHCHCGNKKPMKQFLINKIHQCTECKFWMREEQFQVCDEIDTLLPSEAEKAIWFSKTKEEARDEIIVGKGIKQQMEDKNAPWFSYEDYMYEQASKEIAHRWREMSQEERDQWQEKTMKDILENLSKDPLRGFQ